MSREKWEKKVETIEQNAAAGAAREREIDELYGYTDRGLESQYKTSGVEGRTYDFGKPGELVEVKTGRLSPGQYPKDEQALALGNKLTYHLSQKPTNAELKWLESMRDKYPDTFNYTVGS